MRASSWTPNWSACGRATGPEAAGEVWWELHCDERGKGLEAGAAEVLRVVHSGVKQEKDPAVEVAERLREALACGVQEGEVLPLRPS